MINQRTLKYKRSDDRTPQTSRGKGYGKTGLRSKNFWKIPQASGASNENDNQATISPRQEERPNLVKFTCTSGPVDSLTMPSNRHKTCLCNAPKPIVRPSCYEIRNHPLVQKHRKDNGLSDSEYEDEDSEVVHIMNLAATFLPNKDPDFGNRAFKRPALIEYEKMFSSGSSSSSTRWGKPKEKTPGIKDCDYCEDKINSSHPVDSEVAKADDKPVSWEKEFGFRKGPMKAPVQDMQSNSWNFGDYY